MIHDDVVAGFEDASLPTARFDHTAHVWVAWNYLQREPVLAAAERYRTNLQRYAAAHGGANKYHETITLLYVFVIHERMQRAPGQDWPAFVAANPDVFAEGLGLVRQYYGDDLLADPVARACFVVPSRGTS